MKWVVILLMGALSCTLPETSKFYSEFEFLKRVKFDNDSLTEVKFLSKTCEIANVASSFGLYEKIDNFTCSIQSCLKWCHYNSNCDSSYYGKNICMRAIGTEIINVDKKTYNQFKTRVFYRRHKQIPYLGGHCQELSPKNICNVHKTCRWNRGKRSYRDQIQGASANGWCGTISC